MLTNELTHFPATKARLQSHDKLNSNMLGSFRGWVTSDENKVQEIDDDFEKWDKGIQDMASLGKNKQGKGLSADSISGIYHQKRKPTVTAPSSAAKRTAALSLGKSSGLGKAPPKKKPRTK